MFSSTEKKYSLCELLETEIPINVVELIANWIYFSLLCLNVIVINITISKKYA